MPSRRRFLATTAAVGSLAGCLTPRQVDHASCSTGGDIVPESEYRAVFRDRFETLGLPVERVDEYTFEYTPSTGEQCPKPPLPRVCHFRV